MPTVIFMDTVDRIFTIVTDSIGVLANILLLTAIYYGSSKMRVYSVILGNTAVIELVGAVCSMSVVPRIVPVDMKFLMIFLGPCTAVGSRFCAAAYSLYQHIITMSMFLVCVSFGYRLHVLFKHPPNGVLIQAIIAFIHVVTFVFAFVLYYTSLVFDDSVVHEMIVIRPEYKYLLKDGYIYAGIHDVRHPGSMAMILYVLLSGPVILVCIVIIRRKIVKTLSSTKIHMSTQTINLHRMLTRALTIQLLIPCFLGLGTFTYAANQLQIVEAEWTQYAIIPCSSVLTFVSPCINLYIISTYREYVHHHTLPSLLVQISLADWRRNTNVHISAVTGLIRH